MNGYAEQHAARQYTSTDRLDSRIALHRYGTSTQPWYAWVLDHLPLRHGQHVLEVGAGTGELWTTADLDGITLTLTDASPAMCETLRDRHFPNATVRQCRIDALRFADSSFDGVIANHMLYHLDNPTTGLDELHRVLRPGGWIATATNGGNHMRELREIAHTAGVPAAATKTTLNFSRENGPRLLAAHFTEIREIPYHDELVVPEAEPVVTYLASCADQDLTSAEIAALTEVAEAEIRTHGTIRVTKDTALLLALMPGSHGPAHAAKPA